jgi:hypothetical protein
MRTEAEVEVERRLLQLRRRRGMILKLVRSGHENQLSRMDDFEVWSMLLKLSPGVGRDQVVTMLQDLEVLDYLDFKSRHNEDTGRVELSEIELTALGLRFMVARRSNDDVELM